MGERFFVSLFGSNQDHLRSVADQIQADAMVLNFKAIWVADNRVRIPSTGLEVNANELLSAASAINEILNPLGTEFGPDSGLIRDHADKLRLEPVLFSDLVKTHRREEAMQLRQEARRR